MSAAVLRTDGVVAGPGATAGQSAAAIPNAAGSLAEAMPLALAIVEDHDAFLALQADWDALFARAALPHQVFQSHVVLRHWARHYRERRETLCIVTARRAGRLVMVWPLLRRRRLGLTSLQFMGIPVAQFGDVLVEQREDRAALLQAGWRSVVACGADIFEARKLRADSVLARSGLLAGARMIQREDAPYADLETRIDGDGPSAAYPARERSNHRRRLRRLAERGELVCSALEPGPAAAEAARRAVAMKQAALLRHDVIAPTVSDPRFAAFFGDLAGDASGSSPLRVAQLTCAGEAIGVDLSLDCKGTSFGHVIATHPDHERGGVGKILALHSFVCAKARGNTRFDLLSPADSYKLDHADGLVQVSDLVLPLTLKGRIACGLGLQHLRPALKAAARHLPGSVARRVAVWSRGAKG